MDERGGKHSSKKNYATVEFESAPGGRKEVIYLSYSYLFFSPKHADGEAL